MKRTLFSLLGVVLAAIAAGCAAQGGPTGTASSAGKVDENTLVTLAGNTHPKAQAAYDQGPVDDAFFLDHMQLVLKRSPDREASLAALIDQLHDPASPSFHKWLTPEQFGAYGAAATDIATVTSWLESHGLHVDSVASSGMFLEFSGTAGSVGEAFHTSIHMLSVRGEAHFANMSDPEIPAGLAGVITGVHALHDFMPHPMHKDLGVVKRDKSSGRWGFQGPKPGFTIDDGSDGTFYAVAPADFATIYNLNPLFAEGYRGAGQSIAVVEDTTLKNASDVASFRAAFGLSGYAGTFKQESPTGKTKCGAPGANGDEGEAALDAEWAGAAAPDAAIELAACKDTSTVFGGLIAVENLINAASPPQIISMSYGECESENGAAANASYVNTFQQAAAEGVSVFVSAGDEGAASCDADDSYATHGVAVSGFASTPYNVAVGGTDFMDQYNADVGGPALGTYWQSSNSATYASATSYIPEIPWNDACSSELIYSLEGYSEAYGSSGFCSSSTGKADFLTTAAGSGGPSSYSSQPSWQAGVPGLPTAKGGHRYLPDVSLFAANGVWGHFYVYCMSDASEGGAACNYTNTTDTLDLAAGGTSFASPALAGIQALVNQKAGASQGNPNYTYYRLAAAQFAAGSECNSDQGSPSSPAQPGAGCVFNDVTQGDIDVPCTGSDDCYGASSSRRNTTYGALSTSSSKFGAAYPAGTGWDYATGLGSVNAYNLVTGW